MRKQDSVAVAFTGEGSANQGAFHETLNMAGLWQLPLITVIEDNGWGVSVSKAQSTAVASNVERAAGYGMPGVLVDDNDPCSVYAAAAEAVQRARSGGGPTLIEIRTLRLEGHFVGDVQQYRPEEELQTALRNDPIPRFRARLLAEGLADEAELVRLESGARAEVDAWIQHARDDEYPRPEDAIAAGMNG
jgi:pyruvate dehydrogenase E1 component alpha subunit